MVPDNSEGKTSSSKDLTRVSVAISRVPFVWTTEASKTARCEESPRLADREVVAGMELAKGAPVPRLGRDDRRPFVLALDPGTGMW